jgi:hypothetical protein
VEARGVGNSLGARAPGGGFRFSRRHGCLVFLNRFDMVKKHISGGLILVQKICFIVDVLGVLHCLLLCSE